MCCFWEKAFFRKKSGVFLSPLLDPSPGKGHTSNNKSSPIFRELLIPGSTVLLGLSEYIQNIRLLGNWYTFVSFKWLFINKDKQNAKNW